MTGYRAPTDDMRFTLEHVVGLDRITSLDTFTHVDTDLLGGVLDEAGRFAADVIAPLARVGDTHGSVRNEDGSVTTPPGYREAYARFVEAGWPGAGYPEEWGGGGMPHAVALALQEMVVSADMALSLCPMLTYSAIELLSRFGDDEQKAAYLENLVTGKWSGTMVLTEPQAGSDLGALTTRAVPADDGTWRITGTKIFITWGEHDLTDNIVHFVLARTPDAPPGTRGISCFIVPKFLVGPDGQPGERNDVNCVSIEHKLGIHASPTCVLAFGDGGDGAIGYLIGEPEQGMRYMFTMMNHARISVGLEGLAVSERSYQQASAHAVERRQGRVPGGDRTEAVPIIRHPDVRRMLMMIRSRIEAMRGLVYRAGLALDLAHHHPDGEVRDAEEALGGMLTPVAKAWATDLSVELTSLGIQIHGGSGYIEETGAAQWWRDSRIAPIYEGTNGIQAVDLVMRRLPRDEGAAIGYLFEMIRKELDAVPEELKATAVSLGAALAAVEEATRYLLSREDPADSLSGASTYLMMMGDLVGGWALLKGAKAALDRPPGYSDNFLDGRVGTARFYADHVLPTVAGRLPSVLAGAETTFALPEEAFPGS